VRLVVGLSPCDWFDVPHFERVLRARGGHWGQPLLLLDSAPSTNDLALDAERQGAVEGASFLVREQTEGRGRRGNAWWAPAGDNLTCSVLLRPGLPPTQGNALPLVVGLAVRQVVSDALASLFTAPPVLVKWPNDVWVGSRKIAGILVESRLRDNLVSAAVVGIGLNVGTLEFPEDLAGHATSLARELRPRRSRRRADGTLPPSPPTVPRREDLLAQLLVNLEQRHERFRSAGLSSFLPELDACDALRGRPVRIDDVVGTAAGITTTGGLRVIDPAGRERVTHAGHVELLDAAL
jgi:BirA family transcriptional regulator, biotin operon repressor / biotin---[acetyl-CoA-carboxylase] ligase